LSVGEVDGCVTTCPYSFPPVVINIAERTIILSPNVTNELLMIALVVVLADAVPPLAAVDVEEMKDALVGNSTGRRRRCLI